jgi:hypothetical protein
MRQRGLASVWGALALSCSLGFHPTDFTGHVVAPEGGLPDATVERRLEGGATQAAASPCAVPSSEWLLCEDFEADVIDTSRWNDGKAVRGATTIDQTRAVSGTRSLRAHNEATADGGQTVAYIDRRFALPQEFFTRAYVFIPAAAPFVKNQRTFLMGQEDVDPFGGAQLGLMPRGDIFITDWAERGNFGETNSPFPRDKWVCVEWHVGLGTMSFAVDGTLAPLDASGWPTPRYGRIRLGQWFIGGNGIEAVPASDLWIDDIVVSTAQIGCP